MNIQKEMLNIGQSGCYFLCLLRLAHVEEDALKFYRLFIKNNWIDENCFVKNPEAILNCLFGYTFRCVKSEKEDTKASYIVQYWFNKRTGLHHFTLKDWDPLGESITRKEGTIESYRLFYRTN